jgi:hypothetical protein
LVEDHARLRVVQLVPLQLVVMDQLVLFLDLQDSVEMAFQKKKKH